MATSPPRNHLSLGIIGEKLAAGYLQAKGLIILYRGYRCPRGEIDLVCRDGKELVFVEVKTRASLKAGSPEEAVTGDKQRRLMMAARYFIVEHGLDRVPVRFDVIGIRFSRSNRNMAQITHYPYAFGVD